MEIIDVTGMEPGEILWQRQFVMAPDHFTQVCALVTTAKGPSENKVCILARAPGGQMQGAAMRGMWGHGRGGQPRKMPPAAAPLRAAARRPAGCVARSLHTAAGMLVARALPAGLGASSKMYTLFPDGPLVQFFIKYGNVFRPIGA